MYACQQNSLEHVHSSPQSHFLCTPPNDLISCSLQIAALPKNEMCTKLFPGAHFLIWCVHTNEMCTARAVHISAFYCVLIVTDLDYLVESIQIITAQGRI